MQLYVLITDDYSVTSEKSFGGGEENTKLIDVTKSYESLVGTGWIPLNATNAAVYFSPLSARLLTACCFGPWWLPPLSVC